LPEHCELPGVQVPVHTPPLHVPVVQAAAVPHCPSAPHVCTPPVAHCVAPGLQTPQAPLKHTEPVHAIELPQLPVESHVSTPEPVLSHCVLPGVHLPPHKPLAHAWPTQADPTGIHVP
jgi:hypothetical protein